MVCDTDSMGVIIICTIPLADKSKTPEIIRDKMAKKDRLLPMVLAAVL